jgi:polar amino acid transport system substrate-binding protein
MQPYYSKVRVPVTFLVCLLLVATFSRYSLFDAYAAPAAEDPPGLWDIKRRPDRPDLRIVQQIRFLTEDEYPPFNFQGPSGTLEGFNVDLARAICAELAVTCTVQARRWDTIVAALEAGQGDVIAASLSGTAEARERLLFTAPYYRTPGRFVALRNGPEDASPAALTGKRVAVVADTAHQAYLSTYFRGATLVARPNEAAAREALRSGQADLLFGDGISLAFWLNGSSSADCCRFLGGPYLESRYFGEGVGMALRPTDDTLRRAIDFALFRIWERGIYADLVRRWFPVSPFGEGL